MSAHILRTVQTRPGGPHLPARGKFISLEGLEGVGKTTNLDFIEAALQSAGQTVTRTREPGGTRIGEALRALALSDDGEISPTTELLLMAAARIEHVAKVITPALAAGRWVLCDRYLDASIAYQGGGRELGAAFVADLHERLGVTLKPDLTLLLDMPVADGLARMQARGATDRIEKEGRTFFERTRASYLGLARAEPERIVIIDADQALPAVQNSIALALATRLGIRAGASASSS